MNWLKKIWKDPVWSKVIAAGILALISVIYLSIDSYLKSISIQENFNTIINSEIKIIYVIGVVVLVLLLGILIRKFSKQSRYSDTDKELDEKLFNEIKDSILPNHGSISFLRNHNFGSAFRNDNIDDLHNFVHKLENPDFEFIDKKLEKIFHKLKSSISEFIGIMGTNTWDVSNPNIDARSVPKEWRHEQPDRHSKVVKQLNDYADKICSSYDELIKTGRRKF